MPEDKSKNIPIFSQLQWSCRRGMLELDVLLNNFLNERYMNLGVSEQALFIKLLTSTDPELFAWLTGQEVPNDPELITIVEMIRHHVRTRISS